MNQILRVLGVIPARYSSKRFPGKVLVPFGDKPLLQWVHEKALACPSLDQVVIATDDENVFSSALKFGAKVTKTSTTCRSGSDRAAEVAQQTGAQIIINIQADYPDISPEDIQSVVEFLKNHPEVPMATLSQAFENSADMQNSNHVKVYCDAEGFALNFTREPPAEKLKEKCSEHIGLYGFQKSALQQFANLPQSPREKLESLEQLRALENGFKIKVLSATQRCHSINIPEDISRFLKSR